MEANSICTAIMRVDLNNFEGTVLFASSQLGRREIIDLSSAVRT